MKTGLKFIAFTLLGFFTGWIASMKSDQLNKRLVSAAYDLLYHRSFSKDSNISSKEHIDSLFVQLNQYNDDTLDFFLSLNAWIPSSFGLLEPVEKSSDPLISLAGECGIRDLLMRNYADSLKIPYRRVNFFNVPHQIGHTATELFIEGEWRFFDSTLGVYFSNLDSNSPISLAAARANFPDIHIWRINSEYLIKGSWSRLKTAEYKIMQRKNEKLIDNEISVPDHPELIMMRIDETYFFSQTSSPDVNMNYYVPIVIDLDQRSEMKLGSKDSSSLDLNSTVYLDSTQSYFPLNGFIGRDKTEGGSKRGMQLIFDCEQDQLIEVEIIGLPKYKNSVLKADLDYFDLSISKITSVDEHINYTTSEQSHTFTIHIKPPYTSVKFDSFDGRPFRIDVIKFSTTQLRLEREDMDFSRKETTS